MARFGFRDAAKKMTSHPMRPNNAIFPLLGSLPSQRHKVRPDPAKREDKKDFLTMTV